jgi:hypothetical protein
MMPTTEEIMMVACPKCGAIAGMRCVHPGGAPLSSWHNERSQEARRVGTRTAWFVVVQRTHPTDQLVGPFDSHQSAVFWAGHDVPTSLQWSVVLLPTLTHLPLVVDPEDAGFTT